ncbi:unnamed protein product [Brassica rapa]|uniref:Uncharacterized protein n=2 Tax=Brassica TaxID=3705 RepID=A0A3P6AWR9_BRACM|nr:unnamed protein product [Brassica napus]CAG7894364.1 unnamed protein product [Brassica rapa]CDY41125.1 BnaA02g23470D [Brassica napus]VDC90150.1 unnamed protein product [Brassica rapa]
MISVRTVLFTSGAASHGLRPTQQVSGLPQPYTEEPSIHLSFDPSLGNRPENKLVLPTTLLSEPSHVTAVKIRAITSRSPPFLTQQASSLHLAWSLTNDVATLISRESMHEQLDMTNPRPFLRRKKSFQVVNLKLSYVRRGMSVFTSFPIYLQFWLRLSGTEVSSCTLEFGLWLSGAEVSSCTLEFWRGRLSGAEVSSCTLESGLWLSGGRGEFLHVRVLVGLNGAEVSSCTLESGLWCSGAEVSSCTLCLAGALRV